MVTFQESSITDSQHLEHGSTVLIQFGSHIQFINSIIVNNISPMTQPYLSVSSGCLVAMTNCVYVNNVRQRHVTVQKDSSLIIQDSQFVNNAGNSGSLLAGPTSLFEIHDSKVSITGGNFQNNSFHSKMELYPSFLFHVINSETEFSTSVFAGNAAEYILFTESQFSSTPKYLAIKQCVFNNHKGKMSISNIADVVIDVVVVIGNSSFNSSKEAPIRIMFKQNSWEKKTVALKTLKSTFSDGNRVLQSDSGNLLEEAKVHGFIRISGGVDVNAEETVYASSE